MTNTQIAQQNVEEVKQKMETWFAAYIENPTDATISKGLSASLRKYRIATANLERIQQIEEAAALKQSITDLGKVFVNQGA